MNSNNFHPLRIFVVEDHADTMRIIKRQLERLGHTVFCASTLGEAVAGVAAARCHVLITDVGLPDGSGWDLPELAGLPSSMFTIAMTGRGLESDLLHSRNAGFRHHLMKPYRPAELHAMLSEATEELNGQGIVPPLMAQTSAQTICR